MTLNPEAFLQQTFEGVNDTVSIPCPAGDFMGLAEKVELKTWSSRDGSSSGLKVEILWEILDDTAREETGKDKVFVRQQQMLDLTEDGNLDMGKGRNIGLGRLREALELNKEGEPFSFNMIQGRTATVRVGHRTHEGIIYDEIKSVAKPY